VTDEIAQLQAQREKLDAEIAAAEARRLDAFVAEIKKQINASPFALTKVIARLRERVSTSSRRRGLVYRLKSDPSKIYQRGPVPAWMKDAIVAAGMDPKDGKSREMFKTLHMEQVTL